MSGIPTSKSSPDALLDASGEIPVRTSPPGREIFFDERTGMNFDEIARERAKLETELEAIDQRHAEWLEERKKELVAAGWGCTVAASLNGSYEVWGNGTGRTFDTRQAIETLTKETT